MTSEKVTEGSIAPGRRQVVVIADDDPEILFSLERALRDESFDLLLTTDPQKVLGWLQTRKVGVLISDHRMPVMDGTSLLREASKVSPHSARILLTAYPGDPDILLARKEGLLTLYPKPWDLRELRRAIRMYLREREILGGV